MALPVCQFVDRVGTGAQQRLNLNDGKNFSLLQGPDVRPGPDFSPPKLKRAVVNTLLVDGASIPASAYDNRIIRLPLRVRACDEDEMAEKLETLHRELDRGQNVLKWHPTYNFRPVYFRTFRSPDYRLDQKMEGRAELIVTLSLVAEPFAYGDVVEQTGTINNDPAAVANGLIFEITGAEGDVPTPLFFHGVGTVFAINEYLCAVRRHGTPALYFRQAEAMAQGVDTAVVGGDPLMSGNSYSHTTFADPTMQTRLTWDPAPAAGNSVEYRGLYRLFVRVRRSGTLATITIRVRYGIGFFPAGGTDEVEVPKVGDIQLVDLGLISIPPSPDPIVDGYSEIVLPVENIPIQFQASRAVAAETLDWDYAVLVPADEELSITQFGGVSALGVILDGPNDVAYNGDMALVSSFGPVPRVGSIPLVSPDQTNLYVTFYGIAANTLNRAVDYTARYWPRYLYIR